MDEFIKSTAQKTLQTPVDLQIEHAIGHLMKNPHYTEIVETQEATKAKLVIIIYYPILLAP